MKSDTRSVYCFMTESTIKESLNLNYYPKCSRTYHCRPAARQVSGTHALAGR